MGQCFPVQATAEAQDEVLVCFMRRADIERLVLQYPRVGLKLLERVSARLLETEAALADFANGSVASRPASVLLRLAGPDSEGVVHASHDQLAAQVGSYRETVSTTAEW